MVVGWGEEIIADLPRTKAAVKGLDTIQHFMETEFNHQIEGFLVAGARVLKKLTC